jgi:tetratricopeptide (TPR) repeat protein
MERIVGVDLPEWRSRRAHSLAERCRVIARVAEIVAAAHRVGIVHRDLAPRNIAIGDDGHPRVIDYGIAHTLHSLDEHPTIEGTPGFSSPEQNRGLPAATGDDVYALGKLLAWIAPDARGRIARLIDRATGPRDSLPDAATFAKTLAAHSERKATSAGIMALGAGAAIALGVAAALVARSCGAMEGVAGSAKGGAAREAAAVDRATASSEAIDRILMSLLEGSRAATGGTSETTVLEAIEKAEVEIRAQEDAPIRVRHKALEKIGDIWFDFGEYARAAAVTEYAALLTELDPDASPLRAARLRAGAAGMLARTDDTMRAREAVERSAAELARALPRIGDPAVSPESEAEQQIHADFAQGYVYLALAAKLNGDLSRAREFARVADPFHRTGVYRESASAATYFINTARLAQALGDLEDAIALADEALRISRIAEPEVEQLAVQNLRAGILESAGMFEEATALYEQSRVAWTRIGGPNHPSVVTALNNLGLNALRQGDAARAIPLLEDSIARAALAGRDRHPHTLDTLYHLAIAHLKLGAADRAAEILDGGLPTVLEVRGSPSLDECSWRYALGCAREAQGRLDDARLEWQRTIEIGEGRTGAESDLEDARAKLRKHETSADAAEAPPA